VLGCDKGIARVEFSVQDSGIGIPRHAREKLFEPFVQIDTGMTREYGGVGLGLAICKRIAELMDASLRLESEEGEGSKFTFTVPLAYDVESEEKSAFKGSPTGNSLKLNNLESVPSKRVLVVEDNETNAYYMDQLLGAFGVQAEGVSDGESALRLLSKKSFDIVFLDLHMPGIGGVETLKRLRASEAEQGLAPVPVYILTADASAKAKELCEQLACAGMLIKPVATREIKAILNERFAPA
jgi:CheY-like chemotaxis protein